ncbi:outer membrane protein assembly factor BamE [Sulfitobacter sp.]|uniref:outer membrane protein assembly factor BamE n=1 Tax=Sulfitobacter sp. TaxID=1903071 RepID=UPI003296D562
MGISNTKGAMRHVLLATGFAVALGACTPQFKNHGYIPPAEDLEQITIGVDTRETVAESIGAPSTAGVANDSGFYYVRSRRRTLGAFAPKEIERTVLAISFSSEGVVTNIESFGLERGQVVPLTRRVTTAGVRDKSILRQLLSGIGRFNPASVIGS